MEPATALEHYRNGSLTDAVAAATAAVKAHPEDAASRTLLCVFLCFRGEWERVDNQLDVLATQATEFGRGANLFRQLVRGEMARREFFEQGRVPQCAGEMDENLEQVLQATISLRMGEDDAAARQLEQAEDVRASCPGVCDDDAFEDIRDMDDVTAPYLEAVTVSGDYMWLPFSTISSVGFLPVETLRDVIWRPARVEGHRGSTGMFYVCSRYYGSHDVDDERLALGQATDWSERDGIVRGVGLKTIMVGESCRTVFEIENIEMSRES